MFVLLYIHIKYIYIYMACLLFVPNTIIQSNPLPPHPLLTSHRNPGQRNPGQRNPTTRTMQRRMSMMPRRCGLKL